MNKIVAEIHWADKNYCCGWAMPGVGAVMCTNKTLEGVKSDFEESLNFHIEGMKEDNTPIPDWLEKEEYEIEYSLSVSAILRSIERFTTMAAISRACGINQKLLNNYANAIKVPSQHQRQRIVDGIHKIAEEFMAVV